MNYSDMSNCDINMLVAKLIHPNLKIIKSNSREPSVVAIDVCGSGCNVWLDYCKNPAEAWPIILENNIALEPDTQSFCDEGVDWFLNGKWVASCGDPEKSFNRVSVDKNPLRAAMIVFLMMKDAENAI